MIRIANNADQIHIHRLLRQFYEQAPHSEYSGFDDETVFHAIDAYVNSDKRDKIIFLAEEDGRPYGLLVAVATTIFFTKAEKRAFEIAWFVEPESRGRLDAFRLIDAYEYWAKQVGCKSIQLAHLQTPRLGKLYEKRNYKAVETAYIKELN